MTRALVGRAIRGFPMGALFGFGALIWLGVFFHDRRALSLCAAGASRDSLIWYVAACKAKGGSPYAMLWASPPAMRCEVSREVSP